MNMRVIVGMRVLEIESNSSVTTFREYDDIVRAVSVDILPSLLILS
jgi:hypothetical protein